MAKRFLRGKTPGGTPNKFFWESEIQNERQFTVYYDHLVELAVSMFEWKNLPETIDPRYLELVLFRDGQAVFFKDDALGYLALRCRKGGPFNVYEIPTRRQPYSTGLYNGPELTDEDSVIIFNNFLHKNSMLDAQFFAKKLADLDASIEINARAQKTPILIKCGNTERLTLKNLYMQYDGNAPFIFGDKGLNTNGFQVLNTGAPYVADKLYDLKTQVWNEALTYLGINNINSTKKERLITDEVIRNQGGTIASRYSRLEARRQACDQINRMFGLNIECNYRDDFRIADGNIMDSGDTGDGNADAIVRDLGNE